MIYDTTDTEKLDSHIEDKRYHVVIKLNEISTVRVFNDFNLEFEYWFITSHGGVVTLKIPILKTTYLPWK